MHGHTGHEQSALDLGVIGLVVIVVVAVAYLGAALAENRRGKRHWPAHRSVLWMLGLAIIATTLVGPLAERSHTDFAAHMLAHLLIGMLAPLLLALSAPVTLALRTLDTVPARRLSRLLNSWPARFLTHPIPAAVINVASLWLLYATPLSERMLDNELLHYLLLAHFLIVGYLFTASVVGVDPAPHRTSFRLRMVVLLFAVAAHSILAKFVYLNPPTGSTAPAAEAGGVLMFYGGDVIELALITVFFSQWYRAADPTRSARRPTPHKATRLPSYPES